MSDEQALLEKFRLLPPFERQQVLGLMDTLSFEVVDPARLAGEREEGFAAMRLEDGIPVFDARLEGDLGLRDFQRQQLDELAGKCGL